MIATKILHNVMCESCNELKAEKEDRGELLCIECFTAKHELGMLEWYKELRKEYYQQVM